jgi:predicted nuclease with TOPRIM domain
MGHDCLLDGKTTVKISEADQTILASMGPESLRNVVAESSVAVLKLLEVATFLNSRECKYLRERDEARAHAKDFSERLTIVEQDLLARGKALEDSEAEVAKVKKELKDAKGEVERLKGKIAELEEQVSRMSLAEEEEKKLDPEGTYAKLSRADLIAKIYQIGDLQLEVASSSFQNALAQLQILNPGVQLVTEGLDELKEVRDGRIATPPPDEE